MTIFQAQQAFLIEQQIRGNSPKTVLYYENCFYVFNSFNGDLDLNDFKICHLQRYYFYLKGRDVKLSTITIQSYIRALRSFLTWCYQEEYILTNLSEKFKLPKAKRHTIDILTTNEILRLLKCFNLNDFIGLRNFCICMLMLDSGLRLHEVVCLKISSLHIAEGYILVVGKGNKERFVPLGLNSKKFLLKYISNFKKTNSNATLFIKDDFKPIQDTTVKQLFRKLKVHSDIPRLRPHLLRHTFATSYLENGGDIYSLQVILGHTSLEMVKRYVHTIPSKIASEYTKFSPLDNMMKV